MRSGKNCTIGVLTGFLVLCVGLYITMEAWAVEKSQFQTQLHNAREEASRLVSSLETKLRESGDEQVRLQSTVSDLTAQLSKRESEVLSANSKLQGQSQGDREEERRAKQALEASKRREEGLQKQLARTQEQLRAKQSEQTIKGLTIDVPETPWREMGRVPVWVWWEFPNGIPTGYRLNVRTWMRHIPADKFDLRLVNLSNIKEYIPDLPDAFYRVYPLAQSDFVRAAMIALHGGVYMDGDMLLRDDLDYTFKDLMAGTTDATPYLWEHQECRKSFSTNFMAGIKGNALSREWLRKIYQLMFGRCPTSVRNGDDGMYEYYVYNGCCYRQDGAPRQPCYVTFGAFGDKSAHTVMEEIDKKRTPLRMTCISKWKGMAANASGSGGELLWKKLLPGPPEGYTGPIGPWSKVPKRDQRSEQCWREGKADLRCTQSGLYPVWFERHGYHLFNLNNNDLLSGFKTEEELMNSGTVVAALYREALQGESPDPDPRLAGMNMRPAALSDNNHAKHKMWGDTRQYKLPWLRD